MRPSFLFGKRARRPARQRAAIDYEPRFSDPDCSMRPQTRLKANRCLGYGPPDKCERPSAPVVSHRSQLGPVCRALHDVGCRLYITEQTPGRELKRAVSVIGPSDSLVIYDAMHASGCSVSSLRKLRHAVEKRGGKLMILRVGRVLFLDWDHCEMAIERECRQRAKAAGRYKAGPGRPRRIDPATVGRLKYAGNSVEEIMAQLGCKRSSVYYALKKLKAMEAKAA